MSGITIPTKGLAILCDDPHAYIFREVWDIGRIYEDGQKAFTLFIGGENAERTTKAVFFRDDKTFIDFYKKYVGSNRKRESKLKRECYYN